jgi:aminobenzoyl-glutamate utilization protein B
LLALFLAISFLGANGQQPKSRIKNKTKWKQDLLEQVQAEAKLAQVMVDQVFSFGELGFQETETSAYLTDILERHGFAIERGISGIPTAWLAKWGNGKPVIALGSDIDCIPKASQKPGVAFKEPIVEGAPGHGEGHNSGLPLVIIAAIKVKELMERERLPGTLMIWPGVGEELVASKAWYIRDGHFKDVDACIFTHVDSDMSAAWGDIGNNGIVSVEFTFEGSSAHAAGAPWRGKSALDAVELMNVAWNFKREHQKPTHRSHYVITDGGDQPNVVPSRASVWYYLRERTYEDMRKMYDDAIRYAKAVADMTETKMSYRLLGTAWPGHFNKALAEAMYKNIQIVGLPAWSEDDQKLARAVQRLVDAPKKDQFGRIIDGLATSLDTLRGPVKFSWGGGSDDIADIAWNVPTSVLRFPSNIPGLPGHSWPNAIAMATPIAHKGVVAGAKVVSSTVLDLLLDPKIIADAWDYHRGVQLKNSKYIPFLEADTKPPVHLNQGIMADYRPAMKKYYYDPARYETYLEQLGVKYPELERSDAR